ncbi:HAD family hydrolase [Planococcus koreensis]|uniref:HAD family hydrolase n=1 Tax=Planococcus koreensis TaxID=112331 RepID=UPI0039FDD5C3
MDSIIFDLDGTIWDPIDTVLGAWNSILTREEMNELTREELAATMGMQMDEVGMTLFPALSKERREQLIHECWSLETSFLAKRGGALYENVENVLAELSQKYKLYIVSNCQDGYIEVFYDYHKLEKYFLDFENPGRTSLSKGENINLVIERNSLSKPVYVGDTEGDLKAAKFAGIPFIYAKYGFGYASEYDEAVESFDELLRVFKA